MRLEVGANVGLGQVRRRRRALPRIGEHGVAQDGAELLLRDRILVVALLRRLEGEELDGDHLVEQLLAALRRLVPEAVELIHVLERGGVVAERDRHVADARQHLRCLLVRERGRRRLARIGRVVAAARLAAAGDEGEADDGAHEQPLHGGER